MVSLVPAPYTLLISTRFCIASDGEEVQVSMEGTPTGEPPAQYTGCHNHGEDQLVDPKLSLKEEYTETGIIDFALDRTGMKFKLLQNLQPTLEKREAAARRTAISTLV